MLNGAECPVWSRVAEIFHDNALEYDLWYDESILFAIELTAIKELRCSLGKPKIEVGVGPGRFAEALGVDFGFDPARAPLEIAAPRISGACQGIGEELPLAKSSVATTYLLFTLCFIAEPQLVFAEVFRVLQVGGVLVLGFVPSKGRWGQELTAKREASHPFYQYANFYSYQQVCGWLGAAGFELVEVRSSLFQDPEKINSHEQSKPGYDARAGFVVLAARKK